MNYDDIMNQTLCIPFEQFDMNLKIALKNMGLSTKSEIVKPWAIFNKHKEKQLVQYKVPFTSFSCTNINGIVKELELFYYFEREKKNNIEKKLVELSKFYFACGLAIEKNYAMLLSDEFLNLRPVHFQNFRSSLLNPMRLPEVRISMWFY